ncbi:hypothetical protein EDB87DRAFT_1582957 [Lactarius vividus]|nr:hypothetical protein EDB87DRAFT_1582957 [Lactarius vividus]
MDDPLSPYISALSPSLFASACWGPLTLPRVPPRIPKGCDGVPQRPALPLPVYNVLFAGTNNELPVLRISCPDVERWPKETVTTRLEKSAFLERSVDVSEVTQAAAPDAIATALSDPTIFDFDPLLKLDSVLAAQEHSFFAPLHISKVVLDDLNACQHIHVDTTVEYDTFHDPSRALVQ